MALKTYDMICIFPNSLSDEALETVLTRLDEEIGRHGGQVLSKQPMGERVFARPMQKREAGFYMTLRCELEPTSVEALRGRLKLVDDLFRSQILVADLKAEQDAAEAEAAEAAKATAEATVNG
ncbi:MAG: 30S ribosomal protein S6 [Verrucomicrobia bacterium]|jgi:ribosomal protein S6|nr:30S ribosomal protein S6 [Verrucomicrobiota bacterium]MBT7066611.1 30S ribosomal protein S6 [Verrucomicrobiota bacterium]MBT7699763.1 30S ribosomal protein S6 [Verrucomicrobiota bacterium]